ncbi:MULTISPECIES: O-antigen ligase [Bacillus cereus group]|uniref:O-antigen ligase family protein n=1 Tax=Bacillus cereus group TaxID=86661 RepID=UPI0020BDDD61|nr:O-antigen ligase family protein [Bacillus cereus]MDF9475234.1 O-antigen ligase family protein [Bacillus cereus]MDF9497265.1 O-antigen ligase family protein [Bacillus cereus]MDF9516317.1 O-antigen ligase family protein [Bacillus cereus]MDF9565465.1 O-antigen ligase family protein [Bacillus cereus]
MIKLENIRGMRSINNSILSIIISCFIAFLTSILIYKNVLIGSATALLIVFTIMIFLVCLFIGVQKTMLFLLFVTLAFNIELPLVSFQNGYSAQHPGGLRAALVINQFFLIILFWLIASIKKNQKMSTIQEINYRKSIELVLYIIFVITGIISLLFSYSKIAAVYPVERLLFMLILILLCSKIELTLLWDIFLKAMLVLVPVQFFIGFIQYLTGEPVGLRILGESKNPFRADTVFGLQERGMSGTLGHPGILGIFSTVLLPILLVSFFNINKKRFVMRILLLITIVLNILTIMLTNARTSMAIMAVLIILIFIGGMFIRRNRGLSNKNMILMICCLGLIFLGVLYSMLDKLIERFSGSDFLYQFEYRNGLGDLSMSVLGESFKNFIIGVGPNNYTDVLSKMGTGFAYTQPVHNMYLLMLVEGGIFHFLSYVGLIIAIIFKMLAVIKHGAYDYAFKALGVLSATLGMAVYNFTGWAMYNNQAFIFFTVLCIFSMKIHSESKIVVQKKI